MRLRLATSLTVALLVGLQGPACLALCNVEGKRAESMAAHASSPCHAEAASPSVFHQESEPAEGRCPTDHPSCGDDVPLLTASAKDASGVAWGLLVQPALYERALAPEWRGWALRAMGQEPPPRDLLLVTTSLRL